MLTEYSVNLTKAEAAAILPIFDYIADRLPDGSDNSKTVSKFAAYWRNRLAYAYRVPRIASIQFEIKATTWGLLDCLIDTIQRGKIIHVKEGQPYRLTLGPDIVENIRAIRWAISTQRTNARGHLRPGHYKTLLNATA